MAAKIEMTFPNVLLEFWKAHGMRGMSGDNFDIFSPKEIEERNLTLEASSYCPGFLVIASDTGGKVALIKQEFESDEIYTNHASSMQLSGMHSSGLGFNEWLARGCPFSSLEITPGPSAIQEVKIVMVGRPSLKELVRIRSELGLNVGVSQLKDMHLPATLSTMSYIRAVGTLDVLGLNELEIQDSQTGQKLARKVDSWRTN